MLCLQKCILTRLLSPSPAAPVSPLRRLLSAAAAAAVVSPNPSFAVEQYLVDTCGLTRAQALKASAKVSHLKGPSRPDAVRAFLADLGLSSAAVAAAVSKDPKLLCSSVERTLARNVAGLTALGLSRPEIARLVSLVPRSIRLASIVSKLRYYRPFLGSSEDLFRALIYSSSLLTSSLEKVVKPNVAFLQECGLGACDIARILHSTRWVISCNPKRLPVMVACAEALGVSRQSVMFSHVMAAVGSLGEDKVAAKVEYLKNMFGWSDAEVSIAISKLPAMLKRSKHFLQSRSEFLISEVGLEPAYIARRPAMLSYSFEGRLRPRYYVVKFLKENGLLDHERDYYATVACTDKVFMERYISPHNEAAPYLAEDYATACKGEVPARFRFT